MGMGMGGHGCRFADARWCEDSIYVEWLWMYKIESTDLHHATTVFKLYCLAEVLTSV